MPGKGRVDIHAGTKTKQLRKGQHEGKQKRDVQAPPQLPPPPLPEPLFPAAAAACFIICAMYCAA